MASAEELKTRKRAPAKRWWWVKYVVAAAVLVPVLVPVTVVALLRIFVMDHSDYYAWSCQDSIGAQCANGVCPDAPAWEYEGEYAVTMDWMERVIRSMSWKPDYATAVRFAYQRYEHFLRNQDDYSFTNTDFFPLVWGVDLDDAWDWDPPAFFAQKKHRDRISFVNAIGKDPPPPSTFPKWFYHYMISSGLFDRAPTALDPYAGKYVNNREVGFRWFAPIPLCNLREQKDAIEMAPTCEEKEARQFRLGVHALSDSANEVALEVLLPLCYESCMEPGASCETSQTKRAKFLRRLIQVGYLRLGEVTNCQKRHTSESCILPLSAKAVHVEQEPARVLLEKWLALDDDQHAKWLKNIAAQQLGDMTLIPEDIRIDFDAFPQASIGRFKNIAGPLRMDLWGGTGAVAGDDFFGDDGLIDFYQQTALQWPRGLRSAYMKRNAGNGTWVDVSIETKLIQGPSGNIGKPADYDNDGDLDLFNGRGGWMPMFQLPNSLYENRDGVFYEVTRSSGDSMTGEKGTHSAAWADFDNDGHLDLYVASEQNPCELFRNNGDKTFTEVAAKMGVANCGWVKGVAWGDLNGDGYPDLAVSCISGKNQLYINKQGKGFEDIATDGIGPRFSQPVAVVDLDNDGDDDIVFGAHRPPDPGELYALYKREPWEEQHIMDRRGLGKFSGRTQILLNRGDATFEDVSASTDPRLLTCGVMAMNFGDIDNDGFVDFYMGTGWPDLRGLMPNLMLKNLGNGSFEDATFAGGFGHLQKGHGISFVDVQNDGHLDVAASMGGALTGDLFSDALYLNPADSGNNWIKISLLGHKANKLGHGARLRLKLSDGRDVYSVVGNAASFGSNPVKIHHVGLGKANLLSVSVQWPHKDLLDTPQLVESVPTNEWILIEEGTPAFTLKHLPSFDIDADALIDLHEADHTCEHHHHDMPHEDAFPL